MFASIFVSEQALLHQTAAKTPTKRTARRKGWLRTPGGRQKGSWVTENQVPGTISPRLHPSSSASICRSCFNNHNRLRPDEVLIISPSFLPFLSRSFILILPPSLSFSQAGFIFLRVLSSCDGAPLKSAQLTDVCGERLVTSPASLSSVILTAWMLAPVSNGDARSENTETREAICFEAKLCNPGFTAFPVIRNCLFISSRWVFSSFLSQWVSGRVRPRG